ncbi:MAG: EAL domain-containing protein [Acetobacteraceae bacterium]|nr:EAL domain-containing protein [Acetobacteraceae bacterium]
MLRVVNCIAYDHDLALVALAVGICVVACWAALELHARRARGWSGSTGWLIGSGICFGCGVWATHFVAMLAFIAPVPVSYDFWPMALSIVVSTAGATAAFLIADRGRAIGALIGGVVIGSTIGAMHYVGMDAMTLGRTVAYAPATSASAIALGTVFATLALCVERRGGSPVRRGAAVALLALAVLSPHFTAMAGTTIVPGFLEPGPGATAPQVGALAIAVASVTALILVLAASAVVLDKRSDTETDRLRQLASATFEGILIHRNGTVLDVNDAFCRMVRATAREVIGRPLEDFVTPEDADGVRRQIRRPTGERDEITLMASDGSRSPVEVLGRQIQRADGPARVVAVRDLTERQRAEERMRHMAHHDVLTGLPNRALMDMRLSQALAGAKLDGSNVAVLCIDLDRFKTVNDLLGHQGGDTLLTHVAQRLQGCIRARDTVARLGGDEFVAVLPNLPTADVAASVARRIVEALSRPFELNGSQVSIGASIGVAVAPADGTTADVLLQHADIALYAVKDAGRGRHCFFDESMGVRVCNRRQLEQDLREALAGNQFELFYQPVVDCRTDLILSYEALLRWNHPTRGRVPPNDFIPLAEETGMIVPIGRWVLETACAEAASWPRPLRVAVNLSPVQFQQSDLAAMVMEVLARTGLPPTRLEMEVTEGVLIADADVALRIFGSMKAAGIKIALDDFGSGYSSMTYLRQFPFDKIKIDRAFVRGLGNDHEAQAIVDAILTLARGLRMEVTAEGVETGCQLEALRGRGCDQVQGYFLGIPLPAAELDFSTVRSGALMVEASSVALDG